MMYGCLVGAGPAWSGKSKLKPQGETMECKFVVVAVVLLLGHAIWRASPTGSLVDARHPRGRSSPLVVRLSRLNDHLWDRRFDRSEEILLREGDLFDADIDVVPPVGVTWLGVDVYINVSFGYLATLTPLPDDACEYAPTGGATDPDAAVAKNRGGGGAFFLCRMNDKVTSVTPWSVRITVALLPGVPLPSSIEIRSSIAVDDDDDDVEEEGDDDERYRPHQGRRRDPSHRRGLVPGRTMITMAADASLTLRTVQLQSHESGPTLLRSTPPLRMAAFGEIVVIQGTNLHLLPSRLLLGPYVLRTKFIPAIDGCQLTPERLIVDDAHSTSFRTLINHTFVHVIMPMRPYAPEMITCHPALVRQPELPLETNTLRQVLSAVASMQPSPDDQILATSDIRKEAFRLLATQYCSGRHNTFSPWRYGLSFAMTDTMTVVPRAVFIGMSFGQNARIVGLGQASLRAWPQPHPTGAVYAGQGNKVTVNIMEIVDVPRPHPSPSSTAVHAGVTLQIIANFSDPENVVLTAGGCTVGHHTETRGHHVVVCPAGSLTVARKLGRSNFVDRGLMGHHQIDFDIFIAQWMVGARLAFEVTQTAAPLQTNVQHISLMVANSTLEIHVVPRHGAKETLYGFSVQVAATGGKVHGAVLTIATDAPGRIRVRSRKYHHGCTASDADGHDARGERVPVDLTLGDPTLMPGSPISESAAPPLDETSSSSNGDALDVSDLFRTALLCRVMNIDASDDDRRLVTLDFDLDVPAYFAEQVTIAAGITSPQEVAGRWIRDMQLIGGKPVPRSDGKASSSSDVVSAEAIGPPTSSSIASVEGVAEASFVMLDDRDTEDEDDLDGPDRWGGRRPGNVDADTFWCVTATLVAAGPPCLFVLWAAAESMASSRRDRAPVLVTPPRDEDRTARARSRSVSMQRWLPAAAVWRRFAHHHATLAVFLPCHADCLTARSMLAAASWSLVSLVSLCAATVYPEMDREPLGILVAGVGCVNAAVAWTVRNSMEDVLVPCRAIKHATHHGDRRWYVASLALALVNALVVVTTVRTISSSSSCGSFAPCLAVSMFVDVVVIQSMNGMAIATSKAKRSPPI